ncbi:hypothetical protein BC831DRAFT_442774, partial [Entophlyctis helioformis]
MSPNAVDGSDAAVPAALLSVNKAVTGAQLTSNDMYIQGCIIASLSNILCILCIVLSSRHLYAPVAISKMPLAASFAWCLASLFRTIAAIEYGLHIGIYPLDWMAYACDIVSCSVLLWFIYYRTMTVWLDAWFLVYLTGLFQAMLMSGWLYTAYEQRAGSLLLTTGDPTMLNLAFDTYSVMDLLIVLIDGILVCRMLTLNWRMTQDSNGGKSKLVNKLFFNLSILTLCSIMTLSVVVAFLFVTGRDPFYGYRGILFGFRILLTDIFSNMMRDSLIDDRVQSQMMTALATESGSLEAGRNVQPPPIAPMKRPTGSSYGRPVVRSTDS